MSNCTNETDEIIDPDDNLTENPNEEEKPEEETPGEVIPDNPGSETDLAGNLEIYKENSVEPAYLLVNDAGNNRVYLMNYALEIQHEWELSAGIGNDAVLLPDGNLLVLLMDPDAAINFGGFGGSIELISPENEVLWKFDYSTEDYNLHHDIEILPNGNILAMVWEKVTSEDAKEAGGSLVDTDLYPEAIIEINPTTNEIVWEWHSWDHIVQEYDETKANHGIVKDHPELIDLNYSNDESGDIMHANGIAYDPNKDLIFLSVNFYNEVWVIDHSTSTNEAKAHTGGAFNKGGDLVYRFGNPTTYQNIGNKTFDRNHHPNLLNGIDEGSMLIFSNNVTTEQSMVYQLELPSNYDLFAGVDNELNIEWTYTSTNLYSGKVSGAVRLPNGNTLITEGDSGAREVTTNGEIVWKFSGDGFYWRIYHYPLDSEGILNLNLD